MSTHSTDELMAQCQILYARILFQRRGDPKSVALTFTPQGVEAGYQGRIEPSSEGHVGDALGDSPHAALANLRHKLIECAKQQVAEAEELKSFLLQIGD
jgi:hypothetical protein